MGIQADWDLWQTVAVFTQGGVATPAPFYGADAYPSTSRIASARMSTVRSI